MCLAVPPASFWAEGVKKGEKKKSLEKEAGKMNISLIGQFRLQGLQMEIKVIYFLFLFYSTDFNINTVCNGIQQTLIQAIIHSHNITFLPLLIKSLVGWMLKGWWYDLLLLKLTYFNKYAWDCLDELSQNNKDGLLETSSSIS